MKVTPGGGLGQAVTVLDAGVLLSATDYGALLPKAAVKAIRVSLQSNRAEFEAERYPVRALHAEAPVPGVRRRSLRSRCPVLPRPVWIPGSDQANERSPCSTARFRSPPPAASRSARCSRRPSRWMEHPPFAAARSGARRHNRRRGGRDHPGFAWC